LALIPRRRLNVTLGRRLLPRWRRWPRTQLQVESGRPNDVDASCEHLPKARAAHRDPQIPIPARGPARDKLLQVLVLPARSDPSPILCCAQANLAVPTIGDLPRVLVDPHSVDVPHQVDPARIVDRDPLNVRETLRERRGWHAGRPKNNGPYPSLANSWRRRRRCLRSPERPDIVDVVSLRGTGHR